MTRAQLLQELRKMRFEEACESWNTGRLSQEEAASLMARGKLKAYSEPAPPLSTHFGKPSQTYRQQP